MRTARYAAHCLHGSRETATGVALDLDGAVAEVALAEDGSVRLRAAAGAALPPDPADAVGRRTWVPSGAAPVSLEDGGLRFDHRGPHGSIEVEVAPTPFTVSVRDREGRFVAALSDLSTSPGGGARIALATRPGERFFGGGGHPGGLDRRGTTLRLRNGDAGPGGGPRYASIPFLLALAPDGSARGALLDAFGPTSLDLAASSPDRVWLATDAGGLDLTLFPGPAPRDVVARFTGRVGRTPLPPLWSLGHHQSRWSYSSERAVRRVAAALRARRIPTDAIHLDIDHMDGYRVFTWHPKRFRDPGRLMGDLARQGFRAVAIVDPAIKVDEAYAVFRDGRARGAFCERDDGGIFTLRVWPGEAALPDFDRAAVRDWWGEQHRSLLDAGVAGVWNDMNEPAGWARDLRLGGRAVLRLRDQDLSGVVQSDPADEKRTLPHEHVRNLYGHQQCRATRAFLERERPGRRPFVLTRSGHAGTGRYAAMWSGDNVSRWRDLRASVRELLNLSLSGVPHCGADIGGFAGSCTPELFARWIQLGALQPFARTHSAWTARRQEPWRFGRRVEGIARTALELRMRLLPYLYSLFHEHERSGAPVWRPLFFEFPDDAEVAGVEDQLMLGPSLLVAPVLARGEREREVSLPRGIWYDWHDDTRHVGPARIRVAAPLERLPLFARGGSVVPTQSAVAHTDEAPREPCVLQVFPGADGSAELFEDDGETTAYHGGVVARTNLRLWHHAGGRLRLELGRREGTWEIAPRPARIVVRACGRPDSVHLNGAALAEGSSRPGYAVGAGRLHVRFEDAGGGQTLEVEPAP